MNFELSDMRRRLANLIRVGTIASVDYSTARARVSIGQLLTAPLPWIASRAGDTTAWNAPTVGEQVVVLSQCGDLAQGIILPALYATAHPANGDAATIHRTTYKDGTVVEYDAAAHKLKATVNGSADVTATGAVVIEGATVKLKGAITLEGAVMATSTINASGDIKAGSISLQAHVHGGVQNGGGTTSTPQ